ncbi:MAG: polyhydroxyalkanoate synthesis repressor PhaR [Gammaproteobacteria bacterium]|nr:polyhydroxyalkanoate synthesis repressor PhaR [Gammaproteobacteria bacterium]
MSKSRVIKKYPNRRLYDTEFSRYITISDVRELVVKKIDIAVIDTHTKEDLTRSVLLQIITEQESGGKPIFTTEILSTIIRFYGESFQGMLSRYLEKSLTLFVEQQTQLQGQLQEMISSAPMGSMTDLTQKNLEIWQEMQENFVKTYGHYPTSKQSSSKERKEDD